ncbi:rod shape-determining protein MreC [uncultured Stenotrophomonas sp.]|uniref:rod shape-determining protein MreC n=1 Tax=uncultured Stenotrophomonas sp. TaxID=165438 RepID=UPI000DB1E6EB|nr:rod shape-determining protein MreC [uncultured Stenotrophomonas sp.]PZU29137.1 MAG: rod shape-determining protein MreC [Stenotrophomonas sp.]
MPPYAGPPVASRQGDASSTLRLLAYLALAITLIVLDDQGGWMSRLRAQANVLVQPIWALAGVPGRVGASVKDNAASHNQLVSENRELRNQLLIANARLTRLQTAALDNAQLRELLNVAERNGLDVQLAPILDIDLDPVKQRLVLDSGSRAGVHVGQAVIDAGGLMGQVIAVTPAHSTVLLLTDPDHAVPVAVARNGVRLIVYGRGDRLELRDIPLSAGVEVGDEIVTSGLGGRFPAGFPVGKILKLRPDDTHAFLVGELEPAAKLDRGRNVLLLRSVPALPQLPDSTVIESAPEAAAAGGPSAAPVNRMGAPAAVVPASGNASTPPAAAATQAPASTPATEPAAAGQAPVPATTPANESASPATPVTTDNPTPPQVRP